MDFIRDRSGRCLFQVHNLGVAPDYVKQSAINDECVADLAPGQFADPDRRLFPLDTAGHVYLSHAYAKYAGVSDARILRRIKKAADLLGIGADLTALDAALDGAQVKQAAEAPRLKFALHIDFGAGDATAKHMLVKKGGVHGFYPLNSYDQVLASARDLVNQSAALPEQHFNLACREVVKAADEHGVPRKALPSLLLGRGQHRAPDLAFLREQAEKRSAVTNDPTYRELVAAFEREGDPAGWDKWASLWEQADVLNKYAGDELSFNAWAIFNSGLPVAEVEKEAAAWLLVAEVPVPVSAVASLDEKIVRARLDKTAAEQVTAIKTAAASGLVSDLQAKILQLPRAAQEWVVRLAVQTPQAAAA